MTAVASVGKTASTAEVTPGQTFTYTLTVGCSSITDTGCKDAVLSDVVPAPFQVVGATVGAGANTASDPVITGNTVTVSWTTPLGGGRIGILDATTGIVEITARLPEDASYDTSGIPVVNDARIRGTNFVTVEDQVAVTPVIPLELATTATKSFSPPSLVATPGAPVTAHLGGSNDSNATVESLVLQDPQNSDAAPNPFTYAGFAGFGTVTAPAGTASTTYEVYVGGAWVLAPGGVLPPDVDPAAVRGTRVAFSGAIPAGATASVDLDLELTELAAQQPDGTTVRNDVVSTVARDGATERDVAGADLVLRQNAVTVGATKAFDPELVIAGESSTVTVGGSNTSAIPIQGLTITEPSSGTFSPLYTFAGITAAVTYPAGATSGTITYHFSDDTSETLPFASDTTPPPPTAHGLAEVTSFQARFEGEIAVDASTGIRFQVDTDPEATGLPTAVANEVGVAGDNLGTTGTATARDDLHVYEEQIETYVDKVIRPGRILAVPGEVVTVSPRGGLTERPDPPDEPDGSTGNAARIVIQDPADPIEGNAWWNAFDLTAITQTPVPAGATLTIEYYDVTDATWKTLTTGIAGPLIYSAPVPEEVGAVAGGIRFVYDDTTGDGFPPGIDLAPNFTSELRSDSRYAPGTPPFSDTESTFVPNCIQSGATSVNPLVPDASTTMPEADCPQIELVPPGPGNSDFIDKTFGTSSSGGLKSVIVRSGDTIPSTLRWSTGGRSGLGRVEISDVADPAGTAISDSIYDAFDLMRINPITPSTDPLIAYDQVQSVQLWNGVAWVDAVADPCPAGCIGQFPGLNLSVAERQSTTGVRLVFIESPDRAAAAEGNLDAPPVGSGVARSMDNVRPIVLVWQVRDERRSDGTPVLGDEPYNLPDAGVVRNTANATGYPANGSAPISANDQDDVVLVDVPLTTTTSKIWSGGPIPVPPGEDVPPDQMPATLITVTTRNTTPARVDRLIIQDPAPGSVTNRRQGPFDSHYLERIMTIDVPPGADPAQTVVTLSCFDGSSHDYTREGALALGAGTMPCEISGIRVSFGGRILSNSAGSFSMLVRMRMYWRGTTERVGTPDSPIFNTAQGVVADVDPFVSCPPPAGARYACDQDTANVALEEPVFGINVTKTISPDAQKEDDFGPVTVTMTAQSTGSVRVRRAVFTDQDPSFWNAFDFQGLQSGWSPGLPGTVTACYLDGGVFTAVTVADDSVGGIWTCQPTPGTPADATAFLATAPSTLHGVRVDFIPDTTQWLEPTTVVRAPFVVVRRDALRSGGAVPTTRADQEPAPGETFRGEFTDTMGVEATSAQLSGGQTLTAHEFATDDYRHLHLEAAINVRKTPSGTVRPGVAIPFTLAFTNAGELPLLDPVFSDRLPVDGDGQPQLIFDPDRDPSVPPWSFALTGAAPDPPSGLPLPTDPRLVGVEQTGNVLVFVMPPGSVLEPGQTYTITILLMLRPGVTPEDQITNVAAAQVDVPLDACVPVWDEGLGECVDDTAVSPLAVPALSMVKYVRADQAPDEPGIPDVFSTANNYDCSGSADADGFHRVPCIPVSLPGDTETWRFVVTNAGTLPLDRLVAIDNLPTPGDQGLIVTLPRESAWEPTLVGGIRLVNAPPGASLTTSYSTESVPCTTDLNPLGAGCRGEAWLPFDDSVDPDIVRSLKFSVTFPDGDLFVPGQSIGFEFQTRTTPTRRDSSPYPIAWNTVSLGGSALSGATPLAVPATEGRRVGVSYPTGPIRLEKIVSGPGAQYAPEQFPVQLSCASAGNDVAGLPEVVLTAGADPVRFDGLPWGATCTAIEGDNGQSSVIIRTGTVGGPQDEIGLVTVENVYDVGRLDIAKVVESRAVDADGNPITYGPFDFTVDCTFLGSPVYADGHDPEHPMAATIDGGATWSLTGLPIGAECTVTETGTGGAPSTRMVVTADGTPGDPVDGTSIDVVMGEGSGLLVTTTNSFDDGDLVLTKISDGEAADDFGSGPFTLHVTCLLADDTVWDGDVTIRRDQSITIERIAAGAECTVTEPDAAGATSTVIDPETVTIADEQEAAMTVTNTFDAGSLTVMKVVDGPGAELYGAGPFEVTLTCAGADGREVALIDPLRRLSAADGYTTTYAPLLIDLTCTLTETDTGGAISTSVTITDPAGNETDTIEVAAGTTVATVTNTFELGSLVVDKTVSGSDADAHDGDVFEVTTTCTWNGSNIAIPGGPTRQFSTGTPAEYTDLPVGAECTVTETDTGGATSTQMVVTEGGTAGDPVDGTSVDIVIDKGTGLAVTATNSFDIGSLTVAKVIEGPGAEIYGAGPFEVTLACADADGRDVAIVDPVRRLTAADGHTTTYTPLLIGLSCALTETDTGGATSTSITITDPAGNDTDTIDITPGTTVATVTNTFDLGSLVVDKTVSGGNAAAHDDDVFEVTTTCTWNGSDIAIPGGPTRQFSTGTPAEYTDLPTGAECTVTETDTGGADAVTMTPASPDDPATAVIAIGADAAASVNADNRFGPPLPTTGADLGRWTMVAGTLLLAGMLLLIAVRRRTATDDA